MVAPFRAAGFSLRDVTSIVSVNEIPCIARAKARGSEPKTTTGSVPAGRDSTRGYIPRPLRGFKLPSFKLWRRNLSSRLFFVTLTLHFTGGSSRAADESKSGAASLPPAEEVRLNASLFRDALKKRGLTDILELYLREFPPGGNTEAVVALRDVKLAEFQDPRRPRAERYAAIAEGNDLLEEAIRANPADPRRFEWYFTLAHSLVYHEAEKYFTPIVYHGGTQSQRRRLATLTARALIALRELDAQLSVEFARLEQLNPAEYERLERTGYIESIDRLPARSDYLRLWTLYYDSLARETSDALRVRQLNEIRTHFAEHPALMSTAHDVSHVQLQTLLLAGMTCRLLNDLTLARDHLDRALGLAERLAEPERQRVQWAITLAHVERIRTHRDAHHFDEARAALERFRASIPPEAPDAFGRQLVAAWVERSVWVAAAEQSRIDEEKDEAARYRAKAWRALFDLAAQNPDKRDELYAALYAAMEPDAAVSKLDPLDTAALLAGLLTDAAPTRADQSTTDSANLLQRAVTIGAQFLAAAGFDERPMAPEIMFNVAVAEYRLGRSAAAADRFLRVAREHGDSSLAESALTYAVELAASGVRRPEGVTAEDRQRYTDALELLLARFSHTKKGKYWRFFYARLRAEQGAHVAAAEQFALVDAGHEFALEAKLNRLQSLALHLLSMPISTTEEQVAARQWAEKILSLHQLLTGELVKRMETETDVDAVISLRALRTRARIVAAEVQVHPADARSVEALALLTDMESELPQPSPLRAAVWRTRLIAYQRTGKLSEAAEALPRYVQADPQGAPSTLQKLFTDIMGEAESAADSGNADLAATQAEVAVLLAEQLQALHQSGTGESAMLDARQLDVQLAEALILHRDPARARDTVRGLVDPSAIVSAPKDEWDARARFALAEAYVGLLDHESALKIFNVLATRLPAQHPLRWRALVRDLQCRTALGQAPADILKVIAQQRYLFPDLGGPNRVREFEQLETTNHRREP